jgi:hypothetical protein
VRGNSGSSGIHFHFAEIILGKSTADFFALFLVAIAAFYLAFTAYFPDEEAWRFETMAVVLFAIFGLVGLRVPSLLIVGYLLHGVWDVLHEVHAFGGTDLLGAHRLTELPLAYGAFCASYDWCIAAYFYTQRSQWRAAWKAHATDSSG